MRRIILSLLILSSIYSCTKDSDNSSRQQQLNVAQPSVTSVNFYPVFAGGNESVGFKVVLNIPDSNAVKDIYLYLVPSKLRWTVDKPKTGTYTMYDHVGDYPHGSTTTYYQFEFELTNGSKILLDKFMVN